MSSSSSVAWQTTLYTFPDQLTLSKNAVAESLVAEIPVFALSLLGLGTLIFFIIMQKVKLAVMFISSSILLAFFAVILDLTQTLLRIKKVNDGLSIDSIVPFIIAREVLFAVAVSLRFMAFWAFVGESPRGEAPAVDERDQRPTNLFAIGSDASSLHSGSWDRWGFVGVIWRWKLFLLSIGILALQVLWRVIRDFNKFSAVYEIDAAIEIIASAIFILKLVLNSAIARTPSRWRTFWQYVPMIFALMINMGLAIGNLLLFAFTECAAGRFLLAVEDHIVVVYLLVWYFYPVEAPIQSRNSHRRSSFSGLRITSRESALGAPLMTDLSLAVPQVERQNVPSRLSTATRLSSWILSRADGITGRPRPALERDEERLWNQADLERGVSLISDDEKEGISAYYQTSPATMDGPKESARWQDPVYTTVMADSPYVGSSSRVSPTSEKTRSPPMVTEDRTVIAPIPEETPEPRPISAVPSTVPSYYVRRPSESPLALPPAAPSIFNGSESPIYGLNGTLRGDRYSPAGDRFSRSLAPSRSPLAFSSDEPLAEVDIATARSSGFEALLREQDELEKSIAALKMFAPSTPSIDTEPSSPRGILERDGNRESAPAPSSFTRSSRNDVGSISVKSDFSLSNFPQPPLGSEEAKDDVPDMPNADSSSNANSRESQKDFLDLGGQRMTTQSITFTLIPPRMPAASEEVETRQSLPQSTRYSTDNLGETSAGVSASRGNRLDSQGTQYDVTSFIGGLTVPNHTRRPSSLINEDSEPGSATGSAISATIVTAERQQYTNAPVAQRMVMGRGGRTPPLSESATNSSYEHLSHSRSASDDQLATGRASVSRDPLSSPVLRTSNSNPTLRGPGAGQAARMGTGGRPFGLPQRPNQFAVNSRSPLFDETTAYESPRPAPLAIQTQLQSGTAGAANSNDRRGYI